MFTLNIYIILFIKGGEEGEIRVNIHNKCGKCLYISSKGANAQSYFYCLHFQSSVLSLGMVSVFILPLCSPYFFFPLAKTLAAQGTSPSGVIWTFIPEGAEFLVVLLLIVTEFH